MEKLEQILRTEDETRVALEEAQRASAESIAEARLRAAETLRAGAERTREEAAGRRDEILADARKRVLELEEEAERDARATLDGARVRTDAALDAVLAALRGR